MYAWHGLKVLLKLGKPMEISGVDFSVENAFLLIWFPQRLFMQWQGKKEEADLNIHG